MEIIKRMSMLNRAPDRIKKNNKKYLDDQKKC